MAANIGAVGGVGGAAGTSPLADTRWRSAREPAAAGFGDVLGRALAQVDGLQLEARNAIDAFVRGEPVELHQVMAAAEEAGLALDLLVEIRNKLTEAYRAVINMQS